MNEYQCISHKRLQNGTILWASIWQGQDKETCFYHLSLSNGCGPKNVHKKEKEKKKRPHVQKRLAYVITRKVN